MAGPFVTVEKTPVIRIWLNRTYSTNSHVLAMLRDNPDGRPVQVLASHTDPDSPVLAAADEAYQEPDGLPVDEYVPWALDFARVHRVDVFVPRVRMADIADARDDFAAAGVAVMAPDGDTVRLFADKATAYEVARELGLPVPPHHVVGDAGGLREAYADLRRVAERVCMKPVCGVGGLGYRVLTTGAPDLEDLLGEARPRADLELVCAALDAARAAHRSVPPLLVMPYLPGAEVSVDTLADTHGVPLTSIGRSRSRRRRLLVDDAPAREIAETLVRAHRVAYLSNTQVRQWQGPGDDAPRAYLLELNTRAAGGLFQTALSGVNLAWAAVRLALGEDVGELHPTFGRAYTEVSALVPLPGTGR